MHLKNFSLYAPKGKWILTPAYDLLNVSMVNPKDTEESHTQWTEEANEEKRFRQSHDTFRHCS